MERLMRMLKGLTACVALVSAFVLTTLTTYANTSVSIKLAVDNGFYLFATDPDTNQLVLVGQGYDFNQCIHLQLHYRSLQLHLSHGAR
jgi:hypothetical protein